MSNKNSFHDSWEIQKDASSLGFDWTSISGVVEKVKEEIAEVEEALTRNDLEHAREELGDLFFATVNLARFLGAHPNDAIAEANRKFSRRFSLVCAKAEDRNLDMSRCSLPELDAIWDEVKRVESETKK